MKKKAEKWNSNIFYIYTYMFFAFGIVIFSSLLVRHNSFVAEGDCFNEYYPILSYLSSYYRNFIPNLVQGHVKLYDTAIGFGDDIIGTLNWFGFGDAFTIIAAFFPQKYISYAFTFITILRMYLSGFTFIVYGNSKHLEKRGLLLGSIMYAFCFYALGFGLIAFTFSTSMVYFPLIILGIDRLREKKSTKIIDFTLILSLFFVSLCGFYFLYMIIIASLFYYAIQSGFEKIKISNLLLFTRKAIIIFLNYVIGIGLAGIIFIPSVIGYLKCQRTGDSTVSFIKITETYSLDELRALFRNIIFPANSGYANGLTITVVTLMVFIFCVARWKKKQYRKKCLLFLLTIFGYFFPLIGLVANGFSYSINRWTFIMYFFICYLVSSTFQGITNGILKKDILAYLLAFVGWIITIFYFDDVSKSMLIKVVIYSVMWILTIVLLILLSKTTENYKKKIVANSLWMLSMTNVVVTAFLFFAPIRIGGSGVGASFKALNFVDYEIKNSELKKEISKDDCDESFYRYDINDTSLDAPLMLGVNSTYLYYSVCNGSIFNIFNELRISPAIMHTYLLQGLDGRQVLESLLSVKKYAIDTDSNNIEENNYFLPIGFTYDYAVSEDLLEQYSQLEKTDFMMSGLIIDSNTVGNTSNAVITYDKAGFIDDALNSSKQTVIPIKVVYDSGIIRDGNTISVKENSAIHIFFEPTSNSNDNSELYLFLRNFTSNPSFKADVNLAGKYVRLRAKDDEWYYENNFDYLIQVQNSANKGIIDIVFEEAGEYSLDSIELVNNEIEDFDKKYQALSEDVLENVCLTDNNITGNICLDTGKWMFISLPYSEGWSCKIDGTKTDIAKANYSFMAVYVPEGKHSITMHYVTPGIKLGAFISCISLLGLVICVILQSRRDSALKS